MATPPGIPGAASAPGAATPVAAPFNPEAAPINVAPDNAAGEDRDVLAALTLPAEGAGTATPAAEAEASTGAAVDASVVPGVTAPAGAGATGVGVAVVPVGSEVAAAAGSNVRARAGVSRIPRRRSLSLIHI